MRKRRNKPQIALLFKIVFILILIAILVFLSLIIFNTKSPKTKERPQPNYQKDDSLVNAMKYNYSKLKRDEKNIDSVINNANYNADSVESSIRRIFEKIQSGKYTNTK